jgi:RNA polymerase sigma-70 factor (ECF subfamily)
MFGPLRHRHVAPPAREDSEGAEVGPIGFEAVYRAEFNYVWHVMQSLGVDERDIEDLAHDVFLRVFHALQRFDPTRPMRPWLFGIAFRVVTNFRRLARHRREYPGARTDPPHPDSTAEAVVAARELIFRGMDGLDPEHRAVFVMHDLLGHSMKDASAALEVPLSTLYERLGCARAQFIDRMRQLDEEKAQ